MSDHPKGYCPVFGNYPAEYNRAVHGPYYPWVNYGHRDTPFYDVKLGDFKGWIAKRNKTPQAVIATLGRYSWLWHYKWMASRYGSPSKGVFQLLLGTCVLSFAACYTRYVRPHRNHKYHW